MFNRNVLPRAGISRSQWEIGFESAGKWIPERVELPDGSPIVQAHTGYFDCAQDDRIGGPGLKPPFAFLRCPEGPLYTVAHTASAGC